jgi:hypothetical protein
MAAKSRLPPKAKTTALVCSGRRRPKLSQGMPPLRLGNASSAASQTPISIPMMPMATDVRANLRTIPSL